MIDEKHMEGFVEISVRYNQVTNGFYDWRSISRNDDLLWRMLKVLLNDDLWWDDGELFCRMVILYGETARSGALYMESVQIVLSIGQMLLQKGVLLFFIHVTAS